MASARQTHLDTEDDRTARRRFPPHRCRDGQPRSARCPHVRSIPIGTLGKTGPFSNGVPTDDSNLVARALALGNTSCTRQHRQAHSARRRARWRLHRRCHCAPLGRLPRRRASLAQPQISEPTSASASLGAERRVTGIGEVIEPLPHIDQAVTLIIPPLAVSTPAAYRAWDDLGGPTVDGPNDLEPALPSSLEAGMVARCDRRADRHSADTRRERCHLVHRGPTQQTPSST